MLAAHRRRTLAANDHADPSGSWFRQIRNSADGTPRPVRTYPFRDPAVGFWELRIATFAGGPPFRPRGEHHLADASPLGDELVSVGSPIEGERFGDDWADRAVGHRPSQRLDPALGPVLAPQRSWFRPITDLDEDICPKTLNHGIWATVRATVRRLRSLPPGDGGRGESRRASSSL